MYLEIKTLDKELDLENFPNFWNFESRWCYSTHFLN